MDDDSVQRALASLHRFKALSDQARAKHDVRARHGRRARGQQRRRLHPPGRNDPQRKVRVLSGEEEARFSALGIISGFFDPDGIAGDLGGGSLELIDIKGNEIGKGITLPLGGLRLSEYAGGSLSKAAAFARNTSRRRKSSPRAKGVPSTRSAAPGETSPSCTWRCATIRST